MRSPRCRRRTRCITNRVSALACAYIAGDPVKNPDFLFKASDTLGALKTESSALHRVAAALMIRAAELIEQRPNQSRRRQTLIGVPLTRWS